MPGRPRTAASWRRKPSNRCPDAQARTQWTIHRDVVPGSGRRLWSLMEAAQGLDAVWSGRPKPGSRGAGIGPADPVVADRTAAGSRSAARASEISTCEGPGGRASSRSPSASRTRPKYAAISTGFGAPAYSSVISQGRQGPTTGGRGSQPGQGRARRGSPGGLTARQFLQFRPPRSARSRRDAGQLSSARSAALVRQENTGPRRCAPPGPSGGPKPLLGNRRGRSRSIRRAGLIPERGDDPPARRAASCDLLSVFSRSPASPPRLG